LSEYKTLLTTSRFDVVEMPLPSRDGQTHYRAYIRHPGAVVLLPLLDNDTIVMIENERTGVGETLLELPAGTRDPGEPVLETAARELVEETGYSAAKLDVVCDFYSAPGLGNERMHLIVARDLTPGEQKLETTERIETRLVTREEAETLVRRHEIRDSKTLVGLQSFLLQNLS
jgi:ADP-ribose pyrophosphatase